MSKFSQVGITSASALSALVLIAGCSSSGSSGSTGSPSALSSSTASSTPSTSTSAAPAASSASSASPAGSSSSATTSAAAQKFLSLTAPIDTALQGFLRLPNSTSAATAKAAAGKVARDEATLVTKLKETHWPATAKAALANLEPELVKERAVYARCANASSVAQIKRILLQGKATIAARETASTHVRVAFGLPANG